jgi:hypothetical protein
MSINGANTLAIMGALWRTRFRHAVELDLMLPAVTDRETYRFLARPTHDGAPLELTVSQRVLEQDREVALGAFRDALERTAKTGGRWRLARPGGLQPLE